MAGRNNEAKGILDALIKEWGGLPQFLAEFRAETKGLPQGHANRVKVHLAIFQELMKSGAGEDEGTLEEQRDELRRVTDELAALEEEDEFDS